MKKITVLIATVLSGKVLIDYLFLYPLSIQEMSFVGNSICQLSIIVTSETTNVEQREGLICY